MYRALFGARAGGVHVGERPTTTRRNRTRRVDSRREKIKREKRLWTSVRVRRNRLILSLFLKSIYLFKHIVLTSCLQDRRINLGAKGALAPERQK